MEFYRGIELSKSNNIRNYIESYYFISRTRPSESILDNDKPLQKLVSRYYLKKKIYITLFNFTPYISIYCIIQYIN